MADGFVSPDVAAYAVPTRLAPEAAALARAAELLAAAERPLIVADFCGRDPDLFRDAAASGRALGAGVIDTATRLSMPNRHRLDASGDEEVVPRPTWCCCWTPRTWVALSTSAPWKIASSRHVFGTMPRPSRSALRTSGLSPWVVDHGALRPATLRISADTTVAFPLLIDAVGASVGTDDSTASATTPGTSRELADRHGRHQEHWRIDARRRPGTDLRSRRPISLRPCGTSISDHDWVLAAGDPSGWARRLWDIDRPYRHPGSSLGTATQIGISLGVALAHRGTGRLVVDLQPDGDLLYHPGALWTAVAHRIPLLVVMFNNRAYFNDWNHQITMAKARGTPVERAREGIALDQPSTDFATLARAFGWWSEGPIEDPAQVESVVRRAADVVLDQGKPALVDVICEYR